MSKLNPCIFCKSKNVEIYSPIKSCVRCLNCGAETQMYSDQKFITGAKSAEIDWNHGGAIHCKDLLRMARAEMQSYIYASYRAQQEEQEMRNKLKNQQEAENGN